MLSVGVRQYIEDYLGMPIFPIQYRVYYDAGSLYGVPLSLDLPAVSQNFYANQSGVSVKAVKYWNASNVLTTVPAANYYYDQSGDKVIVTTLPTDISTDRTSPVFCDYTVVANPIADYPVIKQAGLMRQLSERKKSTGLGVGVLRLNGQGEKSVEQFVAVLTLADLAYLLKASGY